MQTATFTILSYPSISILYLFPIYHCLSSNIPLKLLIIESMVLASRGGAGGLCLKESINFNGWFILPSIWIKLSEIPHINILGSILKCR